MQQASLSTRKWVMHNGNNYCRQELTLKNSAQKSEKPRTSVRRVLTSTVGMRRSGRAPAGHRAQHTMLILHVNHCLTSCLSASTGWHKMAANGSKNCNHPKVHLSNLPMARSQHHVCQGPSCRPCPPHNTSLAHLGSPASLSAGCTPGWSAQG